MAQVHPAAPGSNYMMTSGSDAVPAGSFDNTVPRAEVVAATVADEAARDFGRGYGEDRVASGIAQRLDAAGFSAVRKGNSVTATFNDTRDRGSVSLTYAAHRANDQIDFALSATKPSGGTVAVGPEQHYRYVADPPPSKDGVVKENMFGQWVPTENDVSGATK